jgi:hypothetical protein
MHNPEFEPNIPVSLKIYSEVNEIIQGLDNNIRRPLIEKHIQRITDTKYKEEWREELESGAIGLMSYSGESGSSRTRRRLELASLGSDEAELRLVNYFKADGSREHRSTVVEHDFIMIEMELFKDDEPFLARGDFELESMHAGPDNSYTILLGREMAPEIFQTFNPSIVTREEFDIEKYKYYPKHTLSDIDCENLLTYLKDVLPQPADIDGVDTSILGNS